MNSETTVPANVIPNEADVQATGLGGAWRFAEGKIRRGRKGNYEDRPSQKVVGILRRVGIHSGKRESDNITYSQIEVDIETANGLEHFKSSLTDDDGFLKSSSATNGLAWGVLNIGKDERIMITCEEASFVTEKGGKPTFVNIWKTKTNEGDDWSFSQCVRPKRDKAAPKISLVDQWEMMRGQFTKHPAFADRPVSRDDDEQGNATTHLSALCKECAEKGWPTPEQAPGPWLAMMAAAYKHEPRARLSDYPDDGDDSVACWKTIRQALEKRRECPELIRVAAAAPTQTGLDMGALG